MKKAKFFLAAIAVVGIVGGALAFKAKGSLTVYYLTNSTCALAGSQYTTDSNDGAAVAFPNGATITAVQPTTTSDCDVATTFYAEQ